MTPTQAKCLNYKKQSAMNNEKIYTQVQMNNVINAYNKYIDVLASETFRYRTMIRNFNEEAEILPFSKSQNDARKSLSEAIAPFISVNPTTT